MDFVDTAFPLSCFGPEPIRSRAAYLKFVESEYGVDQEKDLEAPAALPCLGSEEFLSRFLELAQRRTKDAPETVTEGLSAVAARISGMTGFAVEEIRSGSRRRAVSDAKRLFAKAASKAGNRSSEIAAFLNCSPCAVTKFLHSEVPADHAGDR